MPAVWRSRYPTHISPSCSVASQISAYSYPHRPRAPSGPAFPFPLLLRAQLAPTEPQRLGEESCLRGSEAQPCQICIFFTGP